MTGPMAIAWRQRLERAVALHQAGQFVEAIRLYGEVLSERPDEVDALHLLGVAFEQAGEPARGKPFVELAAKRAPQVSAYRNSLGNIYKALGDRDAAQLAYLEALRLDSRSAEAHNNLGLLAQQARDWQTARTHFRNAVQLDAGYLPARFNLAVTDWLDGGQISALESFAAVLPQAPEYLGQLVELAKGSLGAKDSEGVQRLLALLDRYGIPPADRGLLAGGLAALEGDVAQAEEQYRAALAHAPDYIEILRRLSRLLMEREAFAEAVPLLERALLLQPEEMPVITALGVALSRTNAHERAIPLLKQAAESQPELPSIWVDLAQSCSKLNRLDEACEALARLIELDPERADNYSTLAGFEARRGNLARAEALCHEALRRDPEGGFAFGNLANIRGLQNRFGEAEDLFRRQFAVRPDDPTTHCNFSYMLLRLRRYREGWQHYSWRWEGPSWTTPETGNCGLPRWDGKVPAPGRVLIWREQGIGDQILYASLLPELAARELDIVFSTEKRLVPLLGRSLPGIEVVAHDDKMDVASMGLVCQRPLGDIAELCRPDAESFSRHPACYLKADPQRVSELRAKYASLPGRYRIGVSWNSRNPNTGRHKSVSVEDMQPLLQLRDAAFVSLQYGEAAADVDRLPRGAIYRDPDIDPLRDIEGQAAQIATLDLVVTVSTAAAHLAAALGIPTLILLPEAWGQLWYWGHEGEQTPWYPQVRICRGETGERVDDIVERAMPMVRAMLAQTAQS